MKNPNYSRSSIMALILSSIALSGCATEIGADGQPHSVITPLGAAAIQAVSAAGIGAGTGALLRGVNPVAAGAISAGAGSIGSQAINGLITYSQQQATLQQKKTAEARARHYYSKMSDEEKAKVKNIAVRTQGTSTTQGVPVMYVNPKTGEAGNTVYDLNTMPKGQVVKDSDMATAFN